MKVRCINEASGLVLNEIYQVIVIHAEGYELINDSARYQPSYFETVLENKEDQFIQIWGMTQEEYLETFGELPQ